MKKYFLSLLIIILIFSDAVAQPRNIRTAERALEKDKLMKAKRRIEKATNHPKTELDPKAWLLKGKIYSTIALDSGNYPSVSSPLQTAIHAFEETQKLASSGDILSLFARQNVETLYHRMMEQAITMADSGHYTVVWPLLAKAKRILPQAPETYLFGGQLAFALQDFERAKENYVTLIRNIQYRDEGLHEILDNLISIQLLMSKDIDSTLTYIHVAQQLLPDSLSFYEKEISLLIAAGNLEEAVSKIQSSHFPDGIKPSLFTAVARAYQQNNQPEHALRQFESALAYQPAAAQLLLTLAEIHQQLGETKVLQANEAGHQEATKHFSAALQYLQQAAQQNNKDHFELTEAIQQIELKLEEITAQN